MTQGGMPRSGGRTKSPPRGERANSAPGNGVQVIKEKVNKPPGGSKFHRRFHGTSETALFSQTIESSTLLNSNNTPRSKSPTANASSRPRSASPLAAEKTSPNHTSIPSGTIAQGDATASSSSLSAPLTPEVICKQLLVGGYVQSYVDFYHLTHRLDPLAPMDNNSSPVQVSLSVDHLLFLKEHFISAEVARRQGDTPRVHAAYIRLANFYAETQRDLRTAQFFHEKSLEVAQLTNDARAEMLANHSLGLIMQQTGRYDTARMFHERHVELATELDALDELGKSYGQLYGVYIKLADNSEEKWTNSLAVASGNTNQFQSTAALAAIRFAACEQESSSPHTEAEVSNLLSENNLTEVVNQVTIATGGDGNAFGDSLSFFLLALNAAKKSWNKAREADANGRIGNLLLNSGAVKESVSFLQQQSQLAGELGNVESRCRSSTALALAWDLLGHSDRAVEELKLVHSISEQSGDELLQAKACKALGTMYSKLGMLSEAVDILQRHFSLLKTVMSKQQQALAAIASGNPATALVAKAKLANETLVTGTDIDMARLFIGISKGNQQMGNYVMAIKSDLTGLLNWKLNRTDLASLPENSLDEEDEVLLEGE